MQISLKVAAAGKNEPVEGGCEALQRMVDKEDAATVINLPAAWWDSSSVCEKTRTNEG